MRMHKWAILVLVQLCLLELASFGLGLFLQAKRRMYVAPVPTDGGADMTYANYLAQRDPFLGWPWRSEIGGPKYDETGTRRLPGIPNTEPPAVSLYGDSFTYGDEVDDEHAWGYLLARALGRRVANYGVGGYGSDQAFLRFRQNTGDPSGVVVLGHLTENILRNLSRNRDLLNWTRFYSLKPRFVIDAQGELQLLELPELDENAYLRSVGVDAPFLAIEHENFQLGGPTGATALKFPFTWSIARNFNYFRMRALLRRQPEYAEFYEPEHPLQGARITLGICAEFAREAERRGKHALVLIFPTRDDVKHFRKTGRWFYATLVDGLRTAKLEFLDFGPLLDERLGARKVSEFFMPRGHYSEEVNALIASTVHKRLSALGWIDRPR